MVATPGLKSSVVGAETTMWASAVKVQSLPTETSSSASLEPFGMAGASPMICGSADETWPRGSYWLMGILIWEWLSSLLLLEPRGRSNVHRTSCCLQEGQLSIFHELIFSLFGLSFFLLMILISMVCMLSQGNHSALVIPTNVRLLHSSSDVFMETLQEGLA